MNSKEIIIICIIVIIVLSSILLFLMFNNANSTTTVTNNVNNTTTAKDTVIAEPIGNSNEESNDGNYIEGPSVDRHGITKEQVMRAGGDCKYDPETGLYLQYDPKYGVYHD